MPIHKDYLDTLFAFSPGLRELDQEKLMAYLQIIVDYAPELSSRPPLVASLLHQAVDGEGIDLQTLNALWKVEAGLQDSRAGRPRLSAEHFRNSEVRAAASHEKSLVLMGLRIQTAKAELSLAELKLEEALDNSRRARQGQ